MELAWLRYAGDTFRKTLMLTARIVLAFSMAVLSGLLPIDRLAQAKDPSAAAVERADEFLGSEAIGTYVLRHAQPGAKYKSHRFQGTRSVKDEGGQLVPGKFAIVYLYKWDADGAGTTKLGFICSRHGAVEEVVVVEPDVIQQQPFLGSEATIQQLGREVVDAFNSTVLESPSF